MLELHPSNWLYNAGVVGFLRVLEECGEDVERFLREDGGVEINSFDDIYKYWEALHDIFMNEILTDATRKRWDERLRNSNDLWKQKVKNVWGTLFNAYARGLFNANTQALDPGDPNNELWGTFEKFFQKSLNLYQSGEPSNYVCSFCCKRLDKGEIECGFHKYMLTSEHNKLLGASPSSKGMPNSFWNLKPENAICSTCTFMILHYFIALIHVSGNSQIFINAPSFKLMWYLNKYVKEVYERKEAKTIKELLGISLIELATRLNIEIGVWTGMNIEVVSKYQVKKDNKKLEDKIDFFSLPYEIVKILQDKDIASLIREIGEFKILNRIPLHQIL